MKSQINRILALRKQIDHHNYLYYNLAKPVISDDRYDLLFQELKELETLHPEMASKLSPTQRVGSAVLATTGTSQHNRPMLSLDNAFTEEDVISFMNRIENKVGRACYICEPKGDGLAISLIYRKGLLVEALTRGDGEVGEVVTEQALAVKGIPLRLEGSDYPKTVEIRGEVMMTKVDFVRLNMNSKKKFANARNAAAGTLRSKDPKVTLERGLIFQAYQLILDGEENLSQLDVFLKVEGWGVGYFNHAFTVCGSEMLLESLKRQQDERARLPFDTDGIVIKVLQPELRAVLGETSRVPLWATAFKFKAMEAVTQLKDVVIQIGRTGVITPVAIFKPVKLGGVTIQRANLHNFDEVKRLDLRVGDYINLKRSGDVIPKITHVILDRRNGSELVIETPTNCPVCLSAVRKEKDGVDLFCTGGVFCEPQAIAKLVHFVSKNGLDIKGLGKNSVELLYKAGLVRHPSDFFKLTRQHLLLALGSSGGESKVAQVIKNLEVAKSPSMDKLISAIGIPGIGKTSAKVLAGRFKTLFELQLVTVEDLMKLPGIGEEVATGVYQYVNGEQGTAVICNLYTVLNPAIVHGSM